MSEWKYEPRRKQTYLQQINEPQTVHLMNEKFDERLMGAVKEENKETFKKVLDQFVTYKTALEFAIISNEGLKSWMDDIHNYPHRVPSPNDLKELKGVVEAFSVESNNYFTEKQVAGLTKIILNGCSQPQHEVGYDLKFLKSLFPSESP